MGLFSDIRSTITLDYKANVDQAKAALRDLSGEQKKAAQAAVTGLEDQIKANERLATKIGLTAGVIGGAVALGISGFKAYEKQVALSSATVGANMDRLRAASRGLMTDMELMEVAASALNSRWKLTAAETENVVGAMYKLQAQGISLEKSSKALGEAFTKGEVEPLKALGVVYDESLAKTDKRAAAVKALTSLSNSAATSTNAEIEAVRRHGAEFRNAMDKIQAAIGQVVVALQPLISALADVTGLVANVVSGVAGMLSGGGVLGEAIPAGWKRAPDFLQRNGSNIEIETLDTLFEMTASRMGSDMADRRAELERIRKQTDDESRRADEKNRLRDLQQDVALRRYAEKFKASQEAFKRRGGGGGGYELNAATASGMENYEAGIDQYIDNMIAEMVAKRLPGFDGGDSPELSALMADGGAETRSYSEDSAVGAFGKKFTARGPSFMERMLGPIEQFDTYANAWSTFTDAATAGYTALVTGSESVGAAMKRIVADSIMAEGKRMLILALREGAESIGSLARGNVPGFLAHGKAALMYGAGAAAAGVAARSLGAGGSVGSTAGAGASSPAGITGAAPTRPSISNYYIGGTFGVKSPREQAEEFERARRNAEARTRPARGVAYA